MESLDVFVTGGTGYMGSRLVPALRERGHRVYTIVRPGSEAKAPNGAISVVGNVLSRDSIAGAMPHGAVVVHLIGTPHPSPAKAAQFEAVDFPAARECIAAAEAAEARRFVYVSVAHPAPVMQAYIDVRVRVEQLLRESPLPCTVLRPWYVLGPGHRWPYLLAPLYWLLRALPSTRDGARRLGLVTIRQMIRALVAAVETPDDTSEVLDVEAIKRHGTRDAGRAT
jgi:uncharacterized protein YbjT (DUF2867 family)